MRWFKDNLSVYKKSPNLPLPESKSKPMLTKEDLKEKNSNKKVLKFTSWLEKVQGLTLHLPSHKLQNPEESGDLELTKPMAEDIL